MVTDVSASPAAVSAESAGNVPFYGNPLTYTYFSHFFSYLNHLAHIFVADRHRCFDGFLSPCIPLVDMKICSANSRFTDFYQYIVHAWFRDRNIFYPQTLLGETLSDCFHKDSFII